MCFTIRLQLKRNVYSCSSLQRWMHWWHHGLQFEWLSLQRLSRGDPSFKYGRRRRWGRVWWERRRRLTCLHLATPTSTVLQNTFTVGKIVPFLCVRVCVCASLPILLLMFPCLYFCLAFLRGVDENRKNRGVCCTLLLFYFFFLFPAPEAPAPQLWGAVSSKGTVVCGPATSAEVFLYLIHFSISHPTEKNSLCKTYCCWRMYYVLVWTVFTIVLHTADMIKVFPDSQSVCFNTLC